MQQELKTVRIISGNFAVGGKNYNGYLSNGERVFIAGRQMASLGWKEDADVKFPFYALMTTKTWNRLGADGKPNGETFDRIQAGSIFTSEEAMFDAFNEDRLLNAKAEQHYQTKAKAAGLSLEDLTAMKSVV